MREALWKCLLTHGWNACRNSIAWGRIDKCLWLVTLFKTLTKDFNVLNVFFKNWFFFCSHGSKCFPPLLNELIVTSSSPQMMHNLTDTSSSPAAAAIPVMLVPWSRILCWQMKGVLSPSPEETYIHHIKRDPVAWRVFSLIVSISVLEACSCLSKELNSPIFSIYITLVSSTVTSSLIFFRAVSYSNPWLHLYIANRSASCHLGYYLASH